MNTAEANDLMMRLDEADDSVGDMVNPPFAWAARFLEEGVILHSDSDGNLTVIRPDDMDHSWFWLRQDLTLPDEESYEDSHADAGRG